MQMASTPTADLSESFFHLSTDTDEPSSDNLTEALMDTNVLEMLRLAQKYDDHAAARAPRNLFAGMATRGGQQSQQTRLDARELHAGQTRAHDLERRQHTRSSSQDRALPETNASDPDADTPGASARSLPRFSSHSTPLGGRHKRNQSPHSEPRDAPVESTAQLLFRAMQPLLEKYIEAAVSQTVPLRRTELDEIQAGHTKKQTDQPTKKTTQYTKKQAAEDSDQESRIDDTFDAEKAADATLGSAMTSPPQSAGNSFVPLETLKAPRVELADLTADNIDVALPLEPELDQSASTAAYIKDLEAQLEQSKSAYAGLLNEVQYLRGKVNNSTRDTPRSAEDITAESLPREFRPFYLRLQLDQIDKMSDREKTNMLKNLLLSLLVTDVEHVPIMAPKVGAFLRMSSAFLDKLHEKTYGDASADKYGMRPLRYLQDYSFSISDGLQECLDGMLARY